MKRVLTALVLIPLVLLVIFKAPDWLMILCIGLIALAAVKEYLTIIKGFGVQPLTTITLLLNAFIFLVYGLASQAYDLHLEWTDVLISFIFISPMILLSSAMGHSPLKEAFTSACYSLLTIPYISGALLSLFLIRQVTGSPFLILFLFTVVWSGDTLAYYVGRSLGKHKMSPIISPKKTWEGAAASVIGSAILGSALLVNSLWISDKLYLHPMHVKLPSIWEAILLSILINIAAQLGDLAESMIKRGANIKDSGSMLPGHGGILDRIDALLFAAPALLIYAIFVR